MIATRITFIWLLMTLALSPLYEDPEHEVIIFRRIDTSLTTTEPQAVYFDGNINLVYANPEAATVNVYTWQGILIETTSVSAFGQVDIDTSDWSSGTYYIYVQSASASYQGVFDYVPVNERA